MEEDIQPSRPQRRSYSLVRIRLPFNTSFESVPLGVVSSVPDISRPESVASCLSDTAVDEVSVCVVRDFFNTDACLQAAAKLMRKP